MAEKEEDFGIIRPTLIKQLKGILDLYPDDGQILKELIQNAEDAGATTVKFLVDEHSHGTDSNLLYHPDLADFQGPALYAYNNAVFEEKDWLGIRMLQDSVKEKDPMKVGRFGLGFKSVLHMTDLPSVLSGDRLAMIDPHEKYFKFQGSNTTGYSWNLKQRKEELTNLAHQFQPYKGIFGCSNTSFTQGCYPGTLFRFPLRKTPSELSETLYSPEKVQELMHSFCADAHLVLLFLNRVECIEVYTRSKDQAEPTLLFKVNLIDNIEELRRKRKQFAQSIKPGCLPDVALSATYPITIQTYNRKETTTQRWLVSNYYASRHVSMHLRQLVADPVMNYFPWVGVAMPITSKKNDDANEESAKIPDVGHVFCFLPLPIEQRSTTGLPVNINGFFAVDQNRRHLKWPTAGLKAGDKSVLWNQCLLKEVVPQAYVQLVLHAVEIQQKSSQTLSAEDVYSALPVISQVDEKWAVMLQTMFAYLFTNAVIFTNNNKGQWKLISEVVLDFVIEDEQMRAVINKCLLQSNVNVASLPPHMIEALYNAGFIELETVTPEFLSKKLRQLPKTTLMLYAKEERLLILKYLLQNGRPEDLYDLPLLPLADGTFGTFHPPRVAKVYIESTDHPKKLIPNMDGIFLASDLESTISSLLNELSKKGATQLVQLDEDGVASLLHRALPDHWYGSRRVLWNPDDPNHPPAEWAEELWKYLLKQFPSDLRQFEGLPLIPYSNKQLKCLMSLASPATLVLKEYCSFMLPDAICDHLATIGVTVLASLPIEIQSHSAVLGQYIVLPLPEDLLDAVLVTIKEKGGHVLEAVNTWPAEAKRALREFLSKLAPSALQEDQRKLLKQLPIFETVEGSGNQASHFVCADDVHIACIGKDVPVHLSKTVVDVSDPEMAQLARVTNIRILNMTSLLKDIIFPDITRGLYSTDKLHLLMKDVLSHLALYVEEDSSFSLDNINFVPTVEGRLTSPLKLFDPDDATLQKLFWGEDVFPGEPYDDAESLILLRQAGLQSLRTIRSADLLSAAVMLDKMVKSQIVETEPLLQKSLTLLQILNEKPGRLQETINGNSLFHSLWVLQWVGSEKEKLEDYPDNLEWFSDDQILHKPGEIMVQSMASLIGSVQPVLPMRISKDLAVAFSWINLPSVEHIVEHMKNCIESYDPKEKTKFISMLTYIYDRLDQTDMGELSDALRKYDIYKWIWEGEGFTSPEQVVLKNPFMELRPYLFMLPTEVQKHQALFLKFGIRQSCDERMMTRVLFLIKIKYDSTVEEIPQEEITHDLQLSIDILNYIKPKEGEILADEIRETLLIPTRIEDDSTVRLLPLPECTYCDVDWLRHGYDLMDFSEDDGITFIHQNLPTSTAESLGVPTLMSKMLHAEELNITGFGQTEPLTTRLKTLLDDYTDGLAIPKELIQNADDSGATEVKFLYDERKNTANMRYLIDDGMRECQGPALWVYNDAVFSDRDFENITKLGGAKKKKVPTATLR